MNRLSHILTLRQPTPLAQACRELEQARRDLLTTSAWAEHYEAQRRMLVGRVVRLESAVRELSHQEREGELS